MNPPPPVTTTRLAMGRHRSAPANGEVGVTQFGRGQVAEVVPVVVYESVGAHELVDGARRDRAKGRMVVGDHDHRGSTDRVTEAGVSLLVGKLTGQHLLGGDRIVDP